MNNLPSILQSAALLVLALAVLVIAVRGFKRLEASVGKVHVVADAVNHAVNNAADGEPTLRQLVVGIDERLQHHEKRLDRIEDHITRPKGGSQ